MKVESYCQTLCHVHSVCQATEWTGCFVRVPYKKPFQSLIPPTVRCVQWSNFWTWKTFSLPNSIANLSKCMRKVSWMRGMCVSGVICLMGQGQMCTMKHNVDGRLSSMRICKAGFMLTVVKTCSSEVWIIQQIQLWTKVFRFSYW
jgi:hypothetical protein